MPNNWQCPGAAYKLKRCIVRHPPATDFLTYIILDQRTKSALVKFKTLLTMFGDLGEFLLNYFKQTSCLFCCKEKGKTRKKFKRDF